MNKWKTALAITAWVMATGSIGVQAGEKSPVPNPQQATIRQSEYRFEPVRSTFRVGKPVELTIINDGTILHEFVTDALHDLTVDVEIHGVTTVAHGVAKFKIPPNGEIVLRFTPDKAGEFSFACLAKKPKNHLKEGMAGLLLFQ